jgi:hypothetical protein
MNERFIESCHFPLIYERKPETKSSYYQKYGQGGILPARLSWGINSICKDSNKLKGKINEINAVYRKAEVGLYKMLNDGKIHTSIWGIPEFPEFYGYGVIDERYNLYDLLILYSDNNCSSSFEVHLFRGMGKPEFLGHAFSYLRTKINKKPHEGL